VVRPLVVTKVVSVVLTRSPQMSVYYAHAHVHVRRLLKSAVAP